MRKCNPFLQGLSAFIFLFILDFGLWSLTLLDWYSPLTIVKTFDLFQMESEVGKFIMATFLVREGMVPGD